MSGQEPGKARFIDPPNILRKKVGAGGIEPLRLQRGEDFIDDTTVDFTPHAAEIMDRLNAILDETKSGKIKGKQAIEKLTQPVMELKANGGMFKYTLMSEIADIVLNFIENIDDLNDDVYEIIEAHQNALYVIVTNQLRGSGGAEGRSLAQELYAACRRYYAKYKIKPRG